MPTTGHEAPGKAAAGNGVYVRSYQNVANMSIVSGFNASMSIKVSFTSKTTTEGFLSFHRVRV
jgi:hypothetical protein